MKPGSNSKHSRGRGNPRRPNNSNAPRTQVFESNGPEVRVRGTVNQVLEKYLALARDASSAGDYVSAENYFQHAEHYYRILGANGGNQGGQQQGGQPQGGQHQGGQHQGGQHQGGQQRFRGPEGAQGRPQGEGGHHGAQTVGGNGSGAAGGMTDTEEDDLGSPDKTSASG